ncbi:MAG: CpaF family protein [Azospirillaceae bacterium]
MFTRRNTEGPQGHPESGRRLADRLNNRRAAPAPAQAQAPNHLAALREMMGADDEAPSIAPAAAPPAGPDTPFEPSVDAAPVSPAPRTAPPPAAVEDSGGQEADPDASSLDPAPPADVPPMAGEPESWPDPFAVADRMAPAEPPAAPRKAPPAALNGGAAPGKARPPHDPHGRPARPRFVPPPVRAVSDTVLAIKDKVQSMLVERIDTASAARMPREELKPGIGDIVRDILYELQVHLNGAEHAQLVDVVMDEMLGLGPLEPLLADESITDIMVNRYNRTYVERRGKLELTDVMFRDDQHVMNIATRIVSKVGRRIDESHPLCDARLPDGSRVNVIIPPLAIDGPSISIRKFAKQSITLDRMVETANLSEQMAVVLKTASRARLNILISGGTGSGKTTLLNALSQLIDHGERIVTIEDAAELQLQQDHTLRLETRTASIEGKGEIAMRDLLKNALRMRPDRIILGEVRGAEVFDMLQAMNTGHEGSMSTIHANRPREALTRLENMVAMAGFQLPTAAVRHQIASAVDLIVQVSRMRDGMRRVTNVTEITGMEGDIITAQELFKYEYDGEEPSGKLRGRYVYSGLRPHFMEKARYFGLDQHLLRALG